MLGSCVAVTMYNRRMALAAMCHGMLPKPRNGEAISETDDQRFRYLSLAIPAMSDRFRHAGIQPGQIEVKLFGGSNLINMAGAPSNDIWIGSANVALARTLLDERHLRIRAENVGGTRGRKILFNTQTGEVLHKHLRKSEGRP